MNIKLLIFRNKFNLFNTMFVKYYKPTGNRSDLLPFIIPGYTRAYTVAELTLKVVREREAIFRQDLLKELKKKRNIHNYSDVQLRETVSKVAKKLIEQGLIRETEPPTLEERISDGLLTYNQIQNYRTWLTYAGVIPSHRYKRGYYSPEELDIFKRTGKYISAGKRAFEALKLSVEEVLGKNKARRFDEWYWKDNWQMAAKRKEVRRAKRATSIH